MKYLITRHAVERLLERTAQTGVFDPRSRTIVNPAQLTIRNGFAIASAHLHRSHRLPTQGQLLFRERHYAGWELPADQVVVRFDDCVYILKEDSTEPTAVSMLQATPEQQEMLEIEPHELFVTIAGAIAPAFVAKARAFGLESRLLELEDVVRRAVHFGVEISWENVKEALGGKLTRGSSRWTWFAGPVATSWDEDHVLDRPYTLVVGMRYADGCSQTNAAYLVRMPFDLNYWNCMEEEEEEVEEGAADGIEDATTIEAPAVQIPAEPSDVEEPRSRDRLYLPTTGGGMAAIRARTLLRHLCDVPHVLYVIRQMRRLRPTPLSSWGVYNVFGLTDHTRSAGCVFRFGQSLPLSGYGMALGYERKPSSKGWRFTGAKVLDKEPDASYLQPLVQEAG